MEKLCDETIRSQDVQLWHTQSQKQQPKKFQNQNNNETCGKVKQYSAAVFEFGYIKTSLLFSKHYENKLTKNIRPTDI